MVERIEKAPKKKGRLKTLTPLEEADRMAGAIIRSRGRCEACGTTERLQHAHGFSRGYRKVRHDLGNGFCLCAGCHMSYTHHDLEWRDWMRAKMGEDAYYDLRRRALYGPRAVVRESVKLLELECARLGLVEVLEDIWARRVA